MSQVQEEEKGMFDDEEFPNIDDPQPANTEVESTAQTNDIEPTIQEAEKQEEKERQTFTYEEDLWDSLSAIQNNSKRGQQLLFGFIHFTKNYTKVLQTFGHGLQKCSETFEKEMLSQDGFDTTTIAITSIRNGINDIVKTIQERINMVYNDLIEPIDMYYKHYQQTSQDQIQQAKKFWSDLEEEKKKMNNAKDRYYKLMHDIELSELSIEQSLLEHEKGNVTIDQVQKITNSTLNIKYKAEVAQQEYKKEIDQLNYHYKRFEDEYKPVLQELQQGEESRINFLKYNFEKFVKHLNALGKSITDKASELQSQVTMINSETDLKIFIDENRTHSEFVKKVDYQPFQYSNEIQKQKAELIKEINKLKTFDNNEDFEVLEEPDEDEAEKMDNYLHNLIRGYDMDFDQKEKVVQSLHKSQVRDTVAEFLKNITSPKHIENASALKTLGELIKYLLTAFVHEKDENYKVIYAILHASQLIFHIREDPKTKEKQKIYLTCYLNDHGIWQEKQMWKTIMQKFLNQRFSEAVHSPGVLAQKAQNQIPQPLQNQNTGLFGQLGKLKGAFFGKEENQQQQKNQDQQLSNTNNKGQQGSIRIQKSLAQNIIFNTISKFLYHFVNYQFPFESAKEVVIYFCDKFELDQNRTHLLLSELESLQRKAKLILTEKDYRNISLEKRNLRIKKYGESTTLIISQALKFVDNDETIRNILCTNNNVYQSIRKKAYKQALLFAQPERLKVKRVQIWKCLLKINENKSDYQAFKNKVANDVQLIQNVEEVINMDVQRSFTKMKNLDPQMLTNILKTYAYFNPEVEYCQGMNFIAGFLYLIFQDEAIAFKALQQIVEEFGMNQLFNQDLPKLKLFFYQMDRLVSIWLPQLHSHFKDEMITSSYYCSAWFITVFTNSLQSQEGDEVGQKLLQLWDYYLTSGWKSIFKMGLIVLKQHEQQLLSMSFEEILNFITEKPKQILTENIESENIDGLLYHQLKNDSKNLINLSYLLTLLEKEFNDSLQAAQDTNIKIMQRNSQKQASQLQSKEEEKSK